MRKEIDNKNSGLFKSRNNNNNNDTGSVLPNLSSDNYIIVRIWQSKVKGKAKGGITTMAHMAIDSERGNIGHASLETPSIYASAWPADDENVTNMFRRYEIDYQPSAVQDELNESGTPELYIKLYSLDIAKLEEAFQQVQDSGSGYTLIGGTSSTQGGQSCCSLTMHLLTKAGINKLNPDKGGSLMSSNIITPNDFGRFVQDAKARELMLYPETQEFSVEDNEYLPQAHTNKCLLM